MRKVAAFFISITCTSLALLSFIATSVSAANNSEILSQSVTVNCGSIKSQIRHLQVSDANTRVALGKSYDRITGELMANFNTRTEINKARNETLIKLTNEFTQFVDYFRKSYVSYDNEISKVLAIDCEAKPSEFYAGLEKLRLLRAGVRSNCDELIKLADQYRAEIAKMKGENE